MLCARQVFHAWTSHYTSIHAAVRVRPISFCNIARWSTPNADNAVATIVPHASKEIQGDNSAARRLTMEKCSASAMFHLPISPSTEAHQGNPFYAGTLVISTSQSRHRSAVLGTGFLDNLCFLKVCYLTIARTCARRWCPVWNKREYLCIASVDNSPSNMPKAR